jgi:hypothetical protein
LATSVLFLPLVVSPVAPFLVSGFNATYTSTSQHASQTAKLRFDFASSDVLAALGAHAERSALPVSLLYPE